MVKKERNVSNSVVEWIQALTNDRVKWKLHVNQATIERCYETDGLWENKNKKESVGWRKIKANQHKKGNR